MKETKRLYLALLVLAAGFFWCMCAGLFWPAQAEEDSDKGAWAAKDGMEDPAAGADGKPAQGFAASHVSSEYEMFQTLKTYSQEELSARGYTDAEIETIQSLTYESAVSDLRDLPREELEGYGYTGEQIDFIKAYDGEPLGDKEIPELSAPLTIALRVYDASTSKVTLYYSWEWASKPLIYGRAIRDVAAVEWQGFGPDSQALRTKYASSGASAQIRYYKNGALVKKTANRIQSGNLGASVYTQIACTIDGGSWAKGGYMYVPIQPAAGGPDLGGATFSVAYLYHLYPLKPDVDGSSIGSTVNGSFAGGLPFQAAFERVTRTSAVIRSDGTMERV